MNMPIRTTRPRPAAAPPIERVQSTATGATDGSIIAPIMRTHSTRKDGNARPIVPGPLPMPRACATVTAHAAAAIAASVSHGNASWRGGRLRQGWATAAGPAWSAILPARSVIAAARSAFVPEVRDEAVRAGEIRVPVAVVARVPGRALPDGLGDGAERQVGEHPRPSAVPADKLITAHRKGASDLGVQRAVRLLERDRRRRYPDDLADQRTQVGQVATRTAGEDGAQGFGLRGGGAVVQVQGHLPAAVGHPLRRVNGHHRVEPGEVHAVLAAIGHVPRQQDVAVVLGGGPEPDAVAADVAVAHLEVVPLDREIHFTIPLSWFPFIQLAGRRSSFGSYHRAGRMRNLHGEKACYGRGPPPTHRNGSAGHRSSIAASVPPSSPRIEPICATESGRCARSQASTMTPTTSQAAATYGVHFRMPGGAGCTDPYRAAPNTIAPITGTTT